MDAPDWTFDTILSATASGVQLRLKVVPGASRTRIVGVLGNRLKVAIAAPPQQGQANIALCRLIAERLNIPIGRIRMTTGAGNANKTLELTGVDTETVRLRLHGCLKASIS